MTTLSKLARISHVLVTAALGLVAACDHDRASIEDDDDSDRITGLATEPGAADHPDFPPSPCGNGVLDPGEECDDGWANSNARECNAACMFNECPLDHNGNCIVDHPVFPMSPCGNGVLDAGEVCDDGWANGPHRACTNACTINECELDPQGNCVEGSLPSDCDAADGACLAANAPSGT